MEIIFRLCGGLGLLLITSGVLVKNRLYQNSAFATGGICLLAYSIYLRDPIFIPLQIVFILASAYELWKLKNK